MTKMLASSAKKLRERAEKAPLKLRGFVYYINNWEKLCRINMETRKIYYWDTHENNWAFWGFIMEYAKNLPNSVDAEIYKQFFVAKPEVAEDKPKHRIAENQDTLHFTKTGKESAEEQLQKEYDKANGTLHIYGQEQWHSEALIIGDKDALTALKDAIDKALKQNSSSFDTFAEDGEGYEVCIALKQTSENLQLPYHNCDKDWIRKTGVSPWDEYMKIKNTRKAVNDE